MDRFLYWLSALLNPFTVWEREKLIRQLGGADHQLTRDAVLRLREKGWHDDGSLNWIILRHADLHALNLSGFDLSYADLRGANLWDTSLKGAKLEGANIIGADLEQANLENADLRETQLQHAQLHGATLPDGQRWTSETDMTYFTDPKSKYYGEPPAQLPI